MKKLKIGLLLGLIAILGGVTLAQTGRGGTIGVGGVNMPGTTNVGADAASGALVQSVIQNAINWILGILAFIALLILLYGGFLMLTAAGDEDKYNKGFTILKQVALGLVMIGLAWFIVSMIFYLIGIIT